MSNWGQKLYAAIEPLDPYLDDRVLIVSGLCLSSFLVFDVELWKASAVTLAVYSLMIFKIGPRVITALCILLFAAAMARWTNIAGINELAAIARHSLVP